MYNLRKVIDTFLRFHCAYHAIDVFYLFKVNRTDVLFLWMDGSPDMRNVLVQLVANRCQW